jgi:hypothetical protein
LRAIVVRRNARLSRVERGLAVVLSVIWLLGGCAGLYVAALGSHWALAAVALAAIVYGLVWLGVAVSARLLTWRDMVAPWRAR